MFLRKFGLTLLFVFALGLSACTSSAAPTETQAPAPTQAAPTHTVVPIATEHRILMCTPPPCATDESYSCGDPNGNCPGGCGTVCVKNETPTEVPSPAPVTGPTIPFFAPRQSITITFINMFDAQTGWAITQDQPSGDDHLARTGDGGATWQDVTPPQPLDAAATLGQAAATFFLNDQQAWATYYDRTAAPLSAPLTIWRTRDGGATWQPSDALKLPAAADFYQISDLAFVDAETGWALMHLGVGMSHDYVAVLGTTDGGQTWSLLIDPEADGGLPMSCGKTGFTFADAKNGWVAGDCGGVVPGGPYFQHTGDGGATWAFVALPAPAEMENLFAEDNFDVACGTFGVQFTSASNGAVMVRCTEFATFSATAWLYTTADGGATWAAHALPGTYNNYAYFANPLTFLDAQTGWLVSDGPSAAEYQLYQTTDGGASWKPVKKLLWVGQVEFVDAQTGWAIAHAEEAIALVKTTTGGGKWNEIKAVVAP